MATTGKINWEGGLHLFNQKTFEVKKYETPKNPCYIITKQRAFFEKIGDFQYADISVLETLPNVIAVDTETTGLTPWVKGIDMFSVQIGTGSANYLIDMQPFHDTYRFKDVQPYLEGKKMVGQNFGFDLMFFYKHKFIPKAMCYDTFLASKILYNGYPKGFRHGFAFIMEQELGLNYDKTAQKNINKVMLRSKKNIIYSFNDVDRLLELAHVLGTKLKRVKATPTYNLHCKDMKVLAYMTMCGLPIDKKLLTEKIENDKGKLEEIEKEVIEYIYDNAPQFRAVQNNLFFTDKKLRVLLTSPQQMIPVFQFFEVDTMGDEGKDTISKDHIQQFKGINSFVDLWLKYTDVNHSVKNFGSNIFKHITEKGRVHTGFNPILDTARISTQKGGVNILNMPSTEVMRRVVRAQKGRKLIVCDYDGQENTVGVDKHGDLMMLAAIVEGRDLHCAFARLIFPELKDLSDEEIVENHSGKRKFAKAPRFAFAYGGSGYTVAMNLKIPLEEGYRLEKLFKEELHKDIYEWGDKMLKNNLKTGYVESVGGFRLHLPFYDDYLTTQAKLKDFTQEMWGLYKKGSEEYKALEADDTYIIENEEAYRFYKKQKPLVSKNARRRSKYSRLGLNNPIQTISAHQTKAATAAIFDHILKRGHEWSVLIVNRPHDEVVLDVPDELVQEYLEVVETCMKVEGDKFLTRGLVKMGCKSHAGQDWYDAK